jgi:hypothetical protein
MRGHGTVGVQSQHGDLRQPHYERCITLLLISYSKTIMDSLTVFGSGQGQPACSAVKVFENPCHHTVIDSLELNGRETHARQRELLSVRPIRATSCTGFNV